MSAHRFEANLSGAGIGQIMLDGHHIERATTGLRIAYTPRSAVEIEVRLKVYERMDLTMDHAEVVIPNETRDALAAMGWTPPAEDGRGPLTLAEAEQALDIATEDYRNALDRDGDG